VTEWQPIREYHGWRLGMRVKLLDSSHYYCDSIFEILHIIDKNKDDGSLTFRVKKANTRFYATFTEFQLLRLDIPDAQPRNTEAALMSREQYEQYEQWEQEQERKWEQWEREQERKREQEREQEQEQERKREQEQEREQS